MPGDITIQDFLPSSLLPFLPVSLPPSLPLSLPSYLSLPPSIHPSLPPSLHTSHSLPPSLPSSSPPSLPPSFSPSLPPFLPPFLHPSLPSSLPPSLPSSLPPSLLPSLRPPSLHPSTGVILYQAYPPSITRLNLPRTVDQLAPALMMIAVDPLWRIWISSETTHPLMGRGALPCVAYTVLLDTVWFLASLPWTEYVMLGESVLDRVWNCPKQDKVAQLSLLIRNLKERGFSYTGYVF